MSCWARTWTTRRRSWPSAWRCGPAASQPEHPALQARRGQTLYNRLARIGELLGTDLDDPQTVLALSLALRARRLTT
ncbi:helix-turn-helix domain-containing protein [Streptomyces microflavus]